MIPDAIPKSFLFTQESSDVRLSTCIAFLTEYKEKLKLKVMGILLVSPVS